MKPKEINWENYNYPPYINIVHFDLNELDDDRKVIFIKLENSKIYSWLFYYCFCNLDFKFLKFYNSSCKWINLV